MLTNNKEAVSTAENEKEGVIMHFKLGVVMEDIGDLESALAPFWQDNEECFEFVDETEFVVAAYKKAKDKRTLEEWAEGQGYVKVGEQWGYHSNPQTEFDWFEIGGRWAQSLLIKADVKEEDYKIEIPIDINILFIYREEKSEVFSEFKDMTEAVERLYEYEDSERWGSLHEFAMSQKLAEVDGRYGLYYNPNQVVEESDPPKAVPEGYRWVDAARIKDIEWELMASLSGKSFRVATVLDYDGEMREMDLSECENPFIDFIKTQNPELFFVVVDCHL